MFNRKRPDLPGTHDVTSLVARHTHIQGEMLFSGSLYLEGQVEGLVHAHDTGAVFTLSEHGVLRGNLRVPVAIINGEVFGDLHITDRLELGAGARVTGDVFYQTLNMAAGAQVNGRLHHLTPESSGTPTPPEAPQALMPSASNGEFVDTLAPSLPSPAIESRRERRQRQAQDAKR